MPIRQADAGELGDKIAEIARIAARRLTENEEDVEKTALENEQTAKFMEGKTPKKVIVVPGKIVNIVM